MLENHKPSVPKCTTCIQHERSLYAKRSEAMQTQHSSINGECNLFFKLCFVKIQSNALHLEYKIQGPVELNVTDYT